MQQGDGKNSVTSLKDMAVCVAVSNAIWSRDNLVPRCLSSGKTSGKVDCVLQSDWSMKMVRCRTRSNRSKTQQCFDFTNGFEPSITNNLALYTAKQHKRSRREKKFIALLRSALNCS